MNNGFDVIYVYTRNDAILDGELKGASRMAKEAGFQFPVAITRAAWNEAVDTPEELKKYGQSNEGRLWDVLNMLKFAIMRSKGNASEIHYSLKVLTTPQKHRVVKLKALCHAGDELEPVITIMLPDED